MDPQLHALGLQLTESAIRNSASAVADRVTAVKARRRNEDTIAELEDIVNNILADKSELVRIARAFEDELIAQRISTSDIEYISSNVVPIIEHLMASAQHQGGTSVQAMIDLLKPLLSVETVTILQLVGFNFRKAIGEPLTGLLSHLITSRADNAAATVSLQRLYLEVAKDPEAHARFSSMLGGQ